jgi:hypothetical protein
MSIRITNDKNRRVIIIKNQDDINHLNTGDMGDPEPSTKEQPNHNNDRIDFDAFDADTKNHYIDTTKYSFIDAMKDKSDPNNVDAPLNTPDDFSPLEDQSAEDFDLQDDPEQSVDDMGDHNPDEFSLDEPSEDNPMDIDSGMGGEDEEQDQDFQGLIRTVRGACLVYKRKDENGTFEELWIYNVGQNLKQETIIRKAILAGTDINPNTQESDDGQQKAKTYTIGNVQYLNITGMVQ